MADYGNPFRGLYPATDSETLSRVAKSLGFVFPPEVFEHYLSFNGGVPERCCFPVDDSYVILHDIYPIGHGLSNPPDETFEAVCQDIRNERHLVPEYLIPFGDDPGGDFFCFSVLQGEEGIIYLYRNEYFDDASRAIRRLAPSIKHFFGSMRNED